MIKVPHFEPGFRISTRDTLVLIAGAVGTIATGTWLWQASVITGFSVGHFFLFCNVFRIGRKPELWWAALFMSLVIITVTTGFPGWPVALGLSLCASVGLILLETRKPSYHGVGWRRLNPGLPAWWQEQHKGASEKPEAT